MSVKISVCMAAYNGEVHIQKQIDSILKQLGMTDQLIIIDDCSTDKTVEIIKSYADQRIHLIVNQENIGAALTFNKALLKAEGEIIFLSDQDDIWYNDKVPKVISFMKESKVDLIVHDAVVVRGSEIINGSLHKIVGSSSGIVKNVISNTFTGSCMAFRSDILKYVLPIHPRIGIYHDAWIGILTQFFRFKVLFVRIPLMDFIRHESNASTLKRRNLAIILKDRFLLIIALMEHIINTMFRIIKLKLRKK
jgi:glycosyltransferase involved in cell wall biosynthesis